MSIKHEKALERSYEIGRETCRSFLKDLGNISLESTLGLLTAGWYTNSLYSVLNVYAPVMKAYVATSEKSVEEIIPRSAEWLGKFRDGVWDEWHASRNIRA